MPTTSIPSARPRIASRPRSRTANGGAELNRSIAARDARKPPSTFRLSSSSRAAVFMTSPLKTMARLMSPISPTITGPKCRLPQNPRHRSELAFKLARRLRQCFAHRHKAAQRATIQRAAAFRPGHDHLVANIIQHFPAIIHDRKGEQTKSTIKKTVNSDPAEPLGEPGRSRDVDEKHKAVFLDRGMIPAGDEIEERARPDNVGDPEPQIHQNRDRGGIDKAEPEILTGSIEGQPGDNLARLGKLNDHDNRGVDRASYN